MNQTIETLKEFAEQIQIAGNELIHSSNSYTRRIPQYGFDYEDKTCKRYDDCDREWHERSNVLKLSEMNEEKLAALKHQGTIWSKCAYAEDLYNMVFKHAAENLILHEKPTLDHLLSYRERIIYNLKGYEFEVDDKWILQLEGDLDFKHPLLEIKRTRTPIKGEFRQDKFVRISRELHTKCEEETVTTVNPYYYKADYTMAFNINPNSFKLLQLRKEGIFRCCVSDSNFVPSYSVDQFHMNFIIEYGFRSEYPELSGTLIYKS